MTRLSAGEALAAAGLVFAGITLLDTTGPGFSHTLNADPADEALRSHLTRAELTTTATLLAGGLLAAVLVRAVWPLLIAAAAAVFAIATHEVALRAASPGGGCGCH